MKCQFNDKILTVRNVRDYTKFKISKFFGKGEGKDFLQKKGFPAKSYANSHDKKKRIKQ